MKKKIFFIFTFLFVFNCCLSQNSTPIDSSQAEINGLNYLYSHTINSSPHLFNGIEYLQYDRTTQGHPFYLSNSWVKGTLVYSNQIYSDVLLLYDIFIDKLIIKKQSSNLRIQLIDENIKEFRLGTKRFIRIGGDDQSNLSKGYYEELYSGVTKLLAKRKKTILEKALAGDYRITLEESSAIYVGINGVYSKVNSKKGLKKILLAKKKEIRKFVATSRSKFREDFEGALVATLLFYDGISKK
jgi:hypothetical protein